MPALNIIVASLLYLELYVWRFGSASRRKIQNAPISSRQYKREIKLTISTITIYSLTGLAMYFLYINGYTKLYFNISQFGFFYLIISVPAMVLIHDTYFYWTHRLLHISFFFKLIHRSHHLSTNPCPWTALSFHPIEAVIQGAIALIIILVIPSHPLALFIFLAYSVITNMLGHTGIELVSYKQFFSKWFWWSNSSKLHNDHHRYSKDNYGLYFTLWDTFMKTLSNKRSEKPNNKNII